MNNSFSFIGGDRRQTYVISGFADDGYTVNVFGIDTPMITPRKNITVCGSLTQALCSADYVVLPVPYSSVLDPNKIHTPLFGGEIMLDDLFASESLSGALILAGKADDRLYSAAQSCGAGVVDYIEREELAVLNAVPTAEGAVKIAMDELPITIHGSECLITGFGRVAKILMRTLVGLGASVSVATRKKGDRAYARAYGCGDIDISSSPRDFKKFDVVFNTVPAPIVDIVWLRSLREDCLIIDLASTPGGVDFDAARRIGRNVIWALSLPGKTAPLTAGKIIHDTICNIIDEQAR